MIKSTFRHEKPIRALSTAFAHVRPKTCLNEHFKRPVGAVYVQEIRVLAPINYELIYMKLGLTIINPI